MKSFNILIVEDESIIALALANMVSNFGYTVIDYTNQPEIVKQCIKNNDIHLILMDINLGTNLNGIDLYKSLECDIPIVYLTAYNDEKTISSAIETNPLGYLIKPHKEEELKALLKLAFYKLQSKLDTQKKDTGTLHLGTSYYFDLKEEKLYFNDIPIRLGSKELQLLKLLVSAKGKTISFSIIENKIWGDNFVSTSATRTLIYRLRSKLEYKLIETVVGHGVKLNTSF